ncbi:MAG: hypothetical protein ACPGOY_04240 [Rhodospirillaceae bacterium]
MLFMLFALYVTGCIAVGILGRNGRLGFFGHFFIGLLFTPFGDLLVQSIASRMSLRKAQEEADDWDDEDSDEEEDPSSSSRFSS